MVGLLNCLLFRKWKPFSSKCCLSLKCRSAATKAYLRQNHEQRRWLERIGSMWMAVHCFGKPPSKFFYQNIGMQFTDLIFFRFKLHRQHLVEFAQVAIHKAYHHDSMINRVMPKDNIALLAVLEVLPGIYKRKPDVPSFVQGEKSTADDLSVGALPEDLVVGSKIVLCAAHVCWDPEFCDVKLIQSMMLVHECARQIEQVSDESGVGLQVRFL